MRIPGITDLLYTMLEHKRGTNKTYNLTKSCSRDRLGFKIKFSINFSNFFIIINISITDKISLFKTSYQTLENNSGLLYVNIRIKSLRICVCFWWKWTTSNHKEVKYFSYLTL